MIDMTGTEARRKNGYWRQIGDVPAAIGDAIRDEVAAAMCRGMRREPATSNTEEAGIVTVRGQKYEYRR